MERFVAKRFRLMFSRRSNPAIIVGIGSLFAATQARAAFTPISSCPFTISAPGDYQLTADLACGGGNAITITARGVSLKLNGHMIVAGGPGNYGIFVNPSGRVDHVTISGPGLITNGGSNVFTAGIALVNADYSQVSQVTVLGSQGSGIAAQNCTFLTVSSNVVGRNGGNGVNLNTVNSSTVAGNDASGNVGPGIALSGGSANTVNNNTANGNSVGIWIGTFAASSARVYGNVTNGNATNGILVTNPGAQVFSNTSAMANGAYDLFDNSGTCAGNLWGGNAFFTANVACIH